MEKATRLPRKETCKKKCERQKKKLKPEVSSLKLVAMTLEQPPFPRTSHAEATGGSSYSTEVERTPHDQRSCGVRILRGVGLF